MNIFTIPPVWKRVAAETLDFFILIVLKVVTMTAASDGEDDPYLKVMITFIAVDFFELVDLEQYELPLDILNIDPEKVIDVDILTSCPHSSWSLVSGHWSLVIGLWSLVIGHCLWSLVFGLGSLVILIITR